MEPSAVVGVHSAGNRIYKGWCIWYPWVLHTCHHVVTIHDRSSASFGGSFKITHERKDYACNFLIAILCLFGKTKFPANEDTRYMY